MSLEHSILVSFIIILKCDGGQIPWIKLLQVRYATVRIV